MSEQEKQVLENLQGVLRSQTLMHLDLSDCGLTEQILIQLSKSINNSMSLLSAHLSGNPGLKDHVIAKITGKLKASYEPPMLKQTFKPLIKLYNNRYGIRPPASQTDTPYTNMRDKILEEIEERDSLSSQ